MTDPDDYLYREHTLPPAQPAKSRKLQTIEAAVTMLKRRARISTVVRATGLTAEQVNEIRARIKP